MAVPQTGAALTAKELFSWQQGTSHLLNAHTGIHFQYARHQAARWESSKSSAPDADARLTSCCLNPWSGFHGNPNW